MTFARWFGISDADLLGDEAKQRRGMLFSLTNPVGSPGKPVFGFFVPVAVDRVSKRLPVPSDRPYRSKPVLRCDQSGCKSTCCPAHLLHLSRGFTASSFVVARAPCAASSSNGDRALAAAERGQAPRRDALNPVAPVIGESGSDAGSMPVGRLRIPT